MAIIGHAHENRTEHQKIKAVARLLQERTHSVKQPDLFFLCTLTTIATLFEDDVVYKPASTV